MRFLISSSCLSGRFKFFAAILLLKIIILRSYAFSETTNIHIIFLELASVSVIIGLLELLKPRTSVSFWIIDFLLSTYFFTNVLYYSHFGNILNMDAILQVTMIKNLGPSILDLLSPVYFIFYLDFFLFFMRHYFTRATTRAGKRTEKRSVSRRSPVHQRMVISIATSLALCLSLITVWSYPAKDNKMAMTRDVGMLNAQGYEIISHFFNSEKPSASIDHFNQSTINEIKQIKPILWPKYFGAASNKNVIIIQLESTEGFVIGLTVDKQVITPNLNSLIKDSLYFPHFYSQIGRGNTSDAEFVSNTSLYPLETGIISADSRNMAFPSLPRLLKTEGYTAVTFHPNIVTYWARHYLYPALGFDKYYDKKFYQDEDFVGRWGSSDETLFKKALPLLVNFQNNKQKFYASFITLTNHHPYILPDNRIRLILPDKLKGSYVGNYLTSVNYMDYALGQFIQDLKANNLWENSILVVYGDHFGISKIQESQNTDFFTPLLGRAHDAIDRLNVPLVIRVPGLKPQIINTSGGQVDILPTLANLLGIPLNQIDFGQDILNYKQNLLGFRYYNPDGTFIDSNSFHLAGSKEIQKLDNHRLMTNEAYYLQEEQRIKLLMQLSDSYIQSLAKKDQEITFKVVDPK